VQRGGWLCGRPSAPALLNSLKSYYQSWVLYSPAPLGSHFGGPGVFLQERLSLLALLGSCVLRRGFYGSSLSDGRLRAALGKRCHEGCQRSWHSDEHTQLRNLFGLMPQGVPCQAGVVPVCSSLN
jgi:hypothetical protein